MVADSRTHVYVSDHYSYLSSCKSFSSHEFANQPGTKRCWCCCVLPVASGRYSLCAPSPSSTHRFDFAKLLRQARLPEEEGVAVRYGFFSLPFFCTFAASRLLRSTTDGNGKDYCARWKGHNGSKGMKSTCSYAVRSGIINESRSHEVSPARGVSGEHLKSALSNNFSSLASLSKGFLGSSRVGGVLFSGMRRGRFKRVSSC